MARLNDLQRNAIENQIEKLKMALERIEKNREQTIAAIESLREALKQ